ncbi:MAG TPA: hypothetical protein K8V56_20470 [Sporosarcina psychrophila]|uniref:Uncharacterized protein n=1 Tax=Sporosarcina psychrophila TaxID=1476 RepID=A0A921G3F4_SPOPS|nr:hypothetical protein [Sporosarcina psychrophila]
MSRNKKRRFIVSVALVLGIGVLTPSYTFASVEKTEIQAPIGQMLKGKVIENWSNEIIIKGEDGKRYHVGLHAFTEEQIQSMNVSVGATVQIEGEVLESFADFYDFAYFVKSLPIGVTEAEIKELETLYNQKMALEKDELWEEAGELWGQINQIINPHYLANWEPDPFDVYISMFEYAFTDEDLIQLEELYNQWISLAKSGAEEESNVKINQFFEIVNNYYVEPTFEEYIATLNMTISEVDYPVIKQLYEEARQTSYDEDNQLAMEKWEAFDLAMQPYYRAAYPMPTFEEQISYYDFEVSKEDLSTLKEIYTVILELEQNGKYEEMEGQWDSFHSILEPYFALNQSIPFRASQVLIDGKTFR